MATTIDLLKNSAFETKMDALIEAVGGGADAGDMKASVYDPQNKAQDVFAYVDDKIAEIPTPDVSAQIATHNSAEDAHSGVLAPLDSPTFTTKFTVQGIVSSGRNTVADGLYSHAEGKYSASNGMYSHAEGDSTIAYGTASHAEGLGAVARADYQHAEGKYNIDDTTKKYAHIVGNGTSNTDRKNAYTLDWEGNGSFAGKVSAGTAENPAAPTAANDLCTKAYVDANKGLSQAAGDGRYLQLAGGAMTGALTLSGAPTNDLHAATKKYVDDNKGASVFLKAWAQLPSSSAVGDIYLLYEAE